MQDTFVAQGQEFAFPKAEYDRRIAAARAALVGAGIDVMVVTGPENIFYLSGQQTPGYYTFQALVLPVEGEPAFVIRQLEYFDFVANTFIPDAEVYTDGDQPVDVLVEVIRRRGLAGKRIVIDKRGWFLPVAVYEALQDRLGTIQDGAGLVERGRAVKSPLEIEKLDQAERYVDAGLQAGFAAVRVGASENDLVAAMMGAAISAGSEYMGMEPLVSVGRRTGVPHGTWRRQRLEADEPAFLEMAACHDRYHAALMRSAWVGAVPDEAADMMKACQEALDAALDALKPGAPCSAPHAACQGVIDRAGTTVVAVLHDLNLAARFCDHLVLLGGEGLVASGPPGTVMTSANLAAAFGLRARIVPDDATGARMVVPDADDAPE